MRQPILGAVLAGGRSSRFGSDKAAAAWNGRSLVEHAAALIGQHVDRVVIGGPGGIADLPEPGLGPLGGIAGALDFAATEGFGSVLTIGCDMPRAPADLILALLRRAPSFCSDAPVLGHWPAALGAQLLAQLSGEDRSVRGWARSVGRVADRLAGAARQRQHEGRSGCAHALRRPAGAMTSSRVEPRAHPAAGRGGGRRTHACDRGAGRGRGGWSRLCRDDDDARRFGGVRDRLHAHRTPCG